jgi:hypothetical protein
MQIAGWRSRTKGLSTRMSTLSMVESTTSKTVSLRSMEFKLRIHSLNTEV